MIRIMVLNIM